jgi:hypothetical protein
MVNLAMGKAGTLKTNAKLPQGIEETAELKLDTESPKKAKQKEPDTLFCGYAASELRAQQRIGF